MNPETTKKLLKTSEGKELCAFFAREVEKLNRLDDLPGSKLSEQGDAVTLAREVRARLLAKERLIHILGSLLDTDTREIVKTNEEYVM